MDQKAPDPADAVSGLPELTRKLQEADLQLQSLLSGEVDAVIGSSGQSYLLQQAQMKLLANDREQRKLLQQLETERANLIAAQALGKIGSWTLEVAVDVLDWSLGMHRIFETDPEHFKPSVPKALARMHPEDRERVRCVFEESLKRPAASVIEHRLQLPGDVVKYVEARWQSELDEAGAMVRVRGTCQDITERRRDEQALRESQARLSMVTRLSRIGAWLIDVRKGVVWWSNEICAFLEVEPGTSPTLQEALAYYAPEWRPSIGAARALCADAGVPYDLEVEIQTARGRRLWMRTIGEAVRDESGAVRWIQGALQDLSDRKLAEQEMRRLATRLSNTLESLTVPFYMVDYDWRITYFNREAERRWNRRRENVLGENLWSEFPELCGSIFEDIFRRAASDRQLGGVEGALPGDDAWFRASVYPSEDGLAIYLRDITVERAEQRQLKLLETSVARLNDAVLITEAAPLDEPGPRICFVNDALLRITGYSREELIGRSPRIFQGPETDQRELRHIRGALSRREPVSAELINYRKNGDAFWLELAMLPVAAEGTETSHFVAIERDITQRKHDQQALLNMNVELEERVRGRTAELEAARQEAEAANRAKSVFLATMSHEIRTPMNGVLGMADVLAQSSLQPVQSEMVDQIRGSADLLLAIIDDILDFSKIEAGKLRIERAPIRIAHVIESTCLRMDTVSLKNGVGLTFFIDPRIPEFVLGDEVRVRQILNNLVGNAIKFSSGLNRAGDVSVRAQCVESRPDAVTLTIEVTDNGIGIAHETLDRLFTPFSQADDSTTRRFGGTGLGLAITHTLVRLMGGEITVRSRLGEGSVFTVRLPFELPATGNIRTWAGTDPQIKGLDIVLVGAVTALAEDVSRYLVNAGARVSRVTRLPVAGLGTSTSECVWVVLPDRANIPMAEIRMAAIRDSAAPPRFLVLGRGNRRVSHAEAVDQIGVDVDGLTRENLLSIVAQAAGRPAITAEGTLQAQPPRLGPVNAASTVWRGPILVAEDNATNRDVIRRQLALMGYTVTLAEDGKQALDQWRKEKPALVLTDLRMPVMDGYALVAAIRAEERPGEHTVIIALTANAIAEEREHCRAAGMDDYLVKPLPLLALQDALDKWCPTANAEINASGAGPVLVRPNAPADLNAVKDLVGDDPANIRAVLESFMTTSSDGRGKLQQAIATGSLKSAQDLAHTLKSGALSVGARTLGELCNELENAAAAGDVPLLDSLWQRFQAELQAVHNHVHSALGN